LLAAVNLSLTHTISVLLTTTKVYGYKCLMGKQLGPKGINYIGNLDKNSASPFFAIDDAK
jgi:hypothetical protein